MMGRTGKHQVDNNPEEILAQNTYNDLSQLTNKKVGGIVASSPLQSIDYLYNIRGWMIKVNDPKNLGSKLFGYEIKYNTVEGLETPNLDYTNLKVKPRYNGNIAEVDWKSGSIPGDNLKRYGYVYDSMDRLLAGFYQKDSNPSAKEYFEKIDYDLNGNITNLKRSAAAQQGAPASTIDILSYTYANNNQSNRLILVGDSSSDYRGYPDTAGIPIAYDNNGNMISHEDKGVLEIKYNYLNLPNYVKFNEYVLREDPFGFGLQTRYKNTTYLYRADGVKLKKVHNYFSGRMQNDAATTTEYLDDFQYSSEGHPSSFSPAILQFVTTPEGYYDFTKNKYIYQYKDLIGNIRLAFFKDAAGSPVVDRETDFYPFGLEFGGTLNTNSSISPNYTYAFQEQEKQQDTGWNSFKWRNYDPTIARFFNPDPLSEEYAYQSHYNFSENAVVNSRELEGLERVIVLGRGAAAAGAAGIAASGHQTGKLTPDWLDNGIKNANHRNNMITATAITVAVWGANEIKDFANSVLKSEGENKNENKDGGDKKNAENKNGSSKSPAQERAERLNKKQRPGKDFTKAGKDVVKDLSREKNDGKTVCENCGIETIPGKRSEKGVTPPSNETQVDHIDRKRDGGSGTPDNGQILCRGCNLEKH